MLHVAADDDNGVKQIERFMSVQTYSPRKPLYTEQ